MNIVRALNIVCWYVRIYLGQLCQSGEAFQPDSSLCITSSCFSLPWNYQCQKPSGDLASLDKIVCKLGKETVFFTLSVCLSVGKLFTVSSFSFEPPSKFQPNLALSNLGWMDSSLYKWRAKPLFKGDNSKLTKIHQYDCMKTFKKIIFSRISIKLGTKHPWVKGIQVYSNGRLSNSKSTLTTKSSSAKPLD